MCLNFPDKLILTPKTRLRDLNSLKHRVNNITRLHSACILRTSTEVAHNTHLKLIKVTTYSMLLALMKNLTPLTSKLLVHTWIPSKISESQILQTLKLSHLKRVPNSWTCFIKPSSYIFWSTENQLHAKITQLKPRSKALRSELLRIQSQVQREILRRRWIRGKRKSGYD